MALCMVPHANRAVLGLAVLGEGERGRRGASGELALLKPRQEKRHACGMLVVGGTVVKVQDSVGNVQTSPNPKISQAARACWILA